MNRFANTLAVLATFALASASPTGPASEVSPAWTFVSGDTIRWYAAAPSRILVVGTDREIVGIAADSGTTLWRVTGLPSVRAGDFKFIGSTSRALVCLRGRAPNEPPKLILIDTRDGRSMWSADSLGFTEYLGGFLLPSSGRFLMGAGQAPDGKRRALVLLDLETGAVLWKSEEYFATYAPPLFDVGGRPTIAPHQPPLEDSDSTLILFMNKHRMRKYDLRRGALLWEASVDSARGPLDLLFERRDSPAPYYGFARMRLAADRQRFFAPFQNSIGCYSVSDGHGSWQKTPRLPGLVTQAEEVSAGLLVTVVDANDPPQRHLVRLDARTGKISWKAPHGLVKNYWLSTSNVLVEEHRAIIAADGKLFAVSLESGKASALADLGFKGEDTPRRLEARKDGFLVSGAQNLVLVARDGRPMFRFYRQPPGGNQIRDALRAVASIAAIAASELGRREWVAREDYVDLLFANRDVPANQGAAIDAEDAQWILADKTGARNKPGLVLVSKSDGGAIGEVTLGADYADYQADRTGGVYIKSDDRTIKCFRVVER